MSKESDHVVSTGFWQATHRGAAGNGRCVIKHLVVALSLAALWAPTLATAQTVVYQEDFENTTDASATGAQSYSVTSDSYVGTTPPGQTYTASTDWLNGMYCNGVILAASNSTQPSWTIAATPTPDNKCRTQLGAQSYNAIRTLARGMGAVFGGADNNHVVSAYTECPAGVCTTIGSGPTNGVMFQTNSLIPVTANRYYTFQVDVGAKNCPAVAVGTTTAGDPQFQFQMIDGGGTATNIGGVLNPCTTGRTSTSVVNLQTSPFTSPTTVYTKQITASQAIKYAGNQLGVKMYNASGATFGNDASFDNIKILDVTPSIGKAFSPTTVAAGGTSTLTFTITNTLDNLAKPGWEFTDNLPTGMTLASTTIGGTCRNFADTGTPANMVGAVGATSINIRGSLPAVASCTVTVTVRIASTVTTPTLQNCGTNFSSSNFVIPPAAGICATVNVTRPVTLTKVWQGATAGNAVSLVISGTNMSGAMAGNSIAPSTTTAATAQAVLGSTVTLGEAFTAGSASDYDSQLSCVRDLDASAVPVTSGSLSGTFDMPNDSGVSCTFTNARILPTFGTCDARMFLDQVDQTQNPDLSTLFNVGYASTPFIYTSLGTGVARNGIGYNALDNYIYGIEWDGAQGNELMRIGSDGSSLNLGTIAGLPLASYAAGVTAPNGDHYVIAGVTGTTAMYRINLTTLTATAITMSRSISVFDLVWYNGLLYSTSTDGQLISINPTTGVVTSIGPTSPVNASIAMWGFANGLFAYNDLNSNIYAIDPATGAATLMSVAPAASNADGANCPTANIQFNADLSVNKTNTPASGPNDLPTDTYSPGETRTYTVVVTNLSGSFGAQNVTVSDSIPAGIDAATVSWTCANTSGGSRCGAASGTGALNDTGLDLPPNAVATYLVTMTVPAGFTGDLTNTVTITPPGTINDTNAANNTATDVDQSAPLLTIRKISIGGVDSFGFTGTNGVVAQTLTTTTAGSPVSGVTQVLTAAGTATTITESTTPAAYQLTGITCTGLGAGGTATPDLVNRTVALDAAATATGANIECTFTNTLQQTDIQVVKTASPDPVVSGEVVTYQIVVSNNGPLAASNVLLTDVAGVGQDCTTPSTTATCSAAGGASCPSPTVPVSSLLGAGITIPVLPVGGLVTISLQCSVSADGL